MNYAAGYLDASTGAAPAHDRFADGRVPVSPRRLGLAAPPGIEPRSAGSEPAALPLSWRMIPKSVKRFSDKIMRKEGRRLVRVRCSAHRRPRSKRGTLLARASPWEFLARTRGFEPLFSAPVTDTQFVAGLGYVRGGGRASEYRSRFSALRTRYLSQQTMAPCWLRSQDSNLPRGD